MSNQAAAEEELLGGVHPQIAHLGWLLGHWRGVGKGKSPNGDGFLFEQELQFASDRRPFLEYRALSWILDEDGQRLHASHAEQGYWRGSADNQVEVVLSNPLGICEIWLGRVEVTGLQNAEITGTKLILSPHAITSAPAAASIHAAERMYGLRDGKLLMTFDMALEDSDAESHIWLMLDRVRKD